MPKYIDREFLEMISHNNTEFYDSYSPHKMNEALKEVETIQQAVACGAANLYCLRGVHGEEAVHNLLDMYFFDLNDFLVSSKSDQNSTIKGITELVLAEYSSLSIVDIYLILRKIKSGEYGLSSPVEKSSIMEIFKTYMLERADALKNEKS